MRLALIPLLACLALPAAPQGIHNSPDVDVTLPLGPNTSFYGPLYQAFDADWTADGRLAFAVVRRQYSKTWTNDRLVVGLYDPATGDTTELGSLTGPEWMFTHVSLAVPDRYFDEEGTGSFDGTTPVHELNRVFVALGAEAPVWSSWNGTTYTQRARAVRVLNVSFTDPDAKLALSSPAKLDTGPSVPAAEPPCPELCLRGSQEGYAVDLVWLDPNTVLPAGGQVLLASSFDQGASFEKVCYVTGPCSAAAKDPKNPLSDSIYSRPVLGWDEQNGMLLLALADGTRGVVHLAAAPDGVSAFEPVASTPQGPLAHSHPRIAVRKGEASVTYLVGQPNGYGWRPLDWFRSGPQGGYVQHQRITERAYTHGDIEVRNNDALIVVRQAPDQGVNDSEVARYDMSRTNAFDLPNALRVNDFNDLSTLPAVAATSPEHAQLGAMPAAVFHWTQNYADHPSGLKLDH